MKPTFLQAKKQIAKLAKGEWHVVEYKETYNETFKKYTPQWSVYVINFHFHSAPTFSEAIASLEKEINSSEKRSLSEV